MLTDSTIHIKMQRISNSQNNFAKNKFRGLTLSNFKINANVTVSRHVSTGKKTDKESSETHTPTYMFN